MDYIDESKSDTEVHYDRLLWYAVLVQELCNLHVPVVFMLCQKMNESSSW